MNLNDAVKTARTVPKFDNESDEADWWYSNRSLIEQDFMDAMDNGSIGPGRSVLLQYAVAPVEPETITLDASDEVAARELAAKYGESFQDYVRRVLHRALQLEKSA